ncbi:MAG: PLP-dependent aminotransferase family protein [Steroidobacteraceae bacterium]
MTTSGAATIRRTSSSFLPPVPLDSGSATPMYRQLSDWFRRAILDHRLKPGQRLPSTRQLAKELAVSRIPVLAAYEQLLAEGYLETFIGAGTCVARSIPQETSKSATLKPDRLLPRPAGPGAARRLSRRAAAIRTQDRSWLSNLGAFRVGLPALDHFPAGVWSKLVNRHARKPPMDLLYYGDTMGYLPLREVIAAYLGVFRAVRCEASQVLVTTGSQQGLQLAAQVLLDPGEGVWIEEPGYPGAQLALHAAGARLVPVPVDQEGLDVAEGLRRGRTARVAYITPSHQFPLGVTLSAARRMQLLNWAAHSGTWIIEDDYDSEYRFEGRPIASLQGLDTDGRVIYLGTFSKVMFPAMRLGYLVLPKDLVPAFAVAREATDTCSSGLYQAVMADFIREGHFARHIGRMRKLYAQRRRALVDAIQQQRDGQLEVLGAEAGMQLTALLPRGVADVAVARKAAKQGVSARPLSACYLHAPARGGLILGYGGADVVAIREAVQTLTTCI